MRPRFVRLGCAALLTAGLAAGCHSSSGTTEAPYPKDPLLLSKKPIEAGNGAAIAAPAPPQLASAEPARPQVPATALVSAAGVSPVPRPYNGYAPDRGTVSARPVATTKGPVQAIPAVRSSHAPETAGGTFGHAPDHRWLQGVLDKHYQGHFGLRYCDPSVEDSMGGKVRLENDPRLAQFQDGDVVRVEGSLVPKDDSTPAQTWDHYPRYRIQSVELIQRKN